MRLSKNILRRGENEKVVETAVKVANLRWLTVYSNTRIWRSMMWPLINMPRDNTYARTLEGRRNIGEYKRVRYEFCQVNRNAFIEKYG